MFAYIRKHWMIPEATPLVVVVTAAATFGVYSSFRHLNSNPDVQLRKSLRGSDVKAIDELAAEEYHEGRLQRGRDMVRRAHGSDFVLSATTNTPWTKEVRESSK